MITQTKGEPEHIPVYLSLEYEQMRAAERSAKQEAMMYRNMAQASKDADEREALFELAMKATDVYVSLAERTLTNMEHHADARAFDGQLCQSACDVGLRVNTAWTEDFQSVSVMFLATNVSEEKARQALRFWMGTARNFVSRSKFHLVSMRSENWLRAIVVFVRD